jgi:hypothetical protein
MFTQGKTEYNRFILKFTQDNIEIHLGLYWDYGEMLMFMQSDANV